jgi:hypothetical protein
MSVTKYSLILISIYWQCPLEFRFVMIYVCIQGPNDRRASDATALGDSTRGVKMVGKMNVINEII